MNKLNIIAAKEDEKENEIEKDKKNKGKQGQTTSSLIHTHTGIWEWFRFTVVRNFMSCPFKPVSFYACENLMVILYFNSFTINLYSIFQYSLQYFLDRKMKYRCLLIFSIESCHIWKTIMNSNQEWFIQLSKHFNFPIMITHCWLHLQTHHKRKY